jgi:hypothetical protein
VRPLCEEVVAELPRSPPGRRDRRGISNEVDSMNSDNRAPTRRLRLFLRDFRMVEAHIALAEGQSLVSWLANRRSYVNLRNAHWVSTKDSVQHAVLKVDQVLWAASIDNDIPLVSTTQPHAPKAVEIQLEGGLLVRGGLSIGDKQRLSDYLEAQMQFIPLRGGLLLRSGRPAKEVNLVLGDVALNQAAVQSMWEIAMQERAEEIEHDENGVPSIG